MEKGKNEFFSYLVSKGQHFLLGFFRVKERGKYSILIDIILELLIYLSSTKGVDTIYFIGRFL